MTALLALVPWYARALILAAVAATLFGYGWLRGVEHQEGIDAPKIAAMQAAGQAQAQHTGQVVQQQKAVTVGVANDYAKNMDALGAYYGALVQRARAARVQQPAAGGSGAVPAVSGPAGSPDAAPSDRLSPGPDTAAVAYAELARDCAAATEQLEALQAWVEKESGLN